jgi:hypothetical protein
MAGGIPRPKPNATALEVISGIAAAVACIASGLCWALAAVLGSAAFDGHPSEYYDAGNRFAFTVALALLSVTCPVVCLGAYVFGRCMDWSRLRSLAIGELASVAPAVLVLVFLI